MQKLQEAVQTVHSYRKMIFWAEMAVLLVFALMYIYFINVTVLHVVAREKLVGDITDLVATVSDLEFNNIALKNSITTDRAATLGFSESENITFLSREKRDLSYNSR